MTKSVLYLQEEDTAIPFKIVEKKILYDARTLSLKQCSTLTLLGISRSAVSEAAIYLVYQ